MEHQALKKVIENLTSSSPAKSGNFESFLDGLHTSGDLVLRNIFQLFHDMIQFYVKQGTDEYPDDPESIGFLNYNSDDLFIKETDKPFFADRLFSNRLMALAKSFRTSAARNKIYLFRGPAGSGKSTFLNNLLAKFEKYICSEEGLVYEVVWRIPRSQKMLMKEARARRSVRSKNPEPVDEHELINPPDEGMFEVPCPNHDNPVLLIPREYRVELLRDIIPEGDFKKKLFKHKQYSWVFKGEPCTVCQSMFQALAEKYTIERIYSMVFARRLYFNRRQSIGVAVFNAGDDWGNNNRTNDQIQQFLNEFFSDSNKVKYQYSSYANTNQGIMALMDLKAKNVQRFLDLHGIISDEVHRVGDIEERIKSLFIVLENPGDLEKVGEKNKKDDDSSVDLSLKDRIHEIQVPYVLDFNTEIRIYCNTFGEQIKLRFMPHVLENFAKIIISSRIKSSSKIIDEWVKDEPEYKKYCDPDFYILKMYLYSGIIPDWLTKEDRASLKAEVRRNIIAESEKDGHDGFSGRESNQIFDEFYTKYSKKRPITMKHVQDFFMDENRNFKEKIPRDFTRHLIDLYDFMVLKEIKDSMYDYNEDEISKTILNYLVGILHNVGDVVKNPFLHNEEFIVTQDFLDICETHLLGHSAYSGTKERYRNDAIREYASYTLGKEIKADGKKITETKQYKEMFSQFTKTSRQSILEPFAENSNFRIAIKEFGTDSFLKYDSKIQQKIKLLFKNLHEKYFYTPDCSKAVCLYVLDNNLKDKFRD